jgi:hypothetical protein
MAYLLDRINQQLARSGVSARTQQSRDWIKTKIGQLRPTPQQLMKDSTRQKNDHFIGHMYFFFYDPKTKDSLPYYDRFPLVIPIDHYPDGFLGLNLHYIHPKQRIILLDNLSSVATDNRFDENTKLRINYQYLKSASRAFEATPCIKRYLSSHIQSRFVQIHANEWDIAALLPVERFEKASTSRVWADSRKKI